MTRKVLFLLFFMLMEMTASPQEITRRDADSIKSYYYQNSICT